MAEDKKQGELGEETEGFEEWNPDDTNQSEEGDESWELDSSADHAWEAAEAQTGFDDVPPGFYEVVVEKVEEKTSQAENKMFSYTMRILEGKQKGRKLFKNHAYAKPIMKNGKPEYRNEKRVYTLNEKTIKWIKGDFSTLGIVLSPPIGQSIKEKVNELLGMMIKVKVRKQKSGEGVNVDFKEYLGRMDGESVEE